MERWTRPYREDNEWHPLGSRNPEQCQRYSWVQLHCSTLGDWRPGLGSSPPAIKSRARLVYLLPTAADCKYTVPGVLGILLVRTIINLGQWAATIGWSLLAKYRRSAMKSLIWVNVHFAEKATKMPDKGQDAYFCKWRVFARCSALFDVAS